jgi:fused signal recognition particle receptor
MTTSAGAGFFGRLRERLAGGKRLLAALLPAGEIDAALLDELETRLIAADVGVEASERILTALRGRLARHELRDRGALEQALAEVLTAILAPVARPLVIDSRHRPFVILVVGVNGSGKTTSIGKLARRLKDEGRTVMIAAGDTFRAAAVEQLRVWGERNGVAVVSQAAGADPAAVVFDALAAARARAVDVLIADTAGRLHNQSHLMDELAKVKRVIGRQDPSAPHEVLLVLDASQGQNALAQAESFNAALGVTGIVLTKLDGTAKGGIVFAIAERLKLALRYVGVGEEALDFGPFEAAPFVTALLGGPP